MRFSIVPIDRVSGLRSALCGRRVAKSVSVRQAPSLFPNIFIIFDKMNKREKILTL